MLPGKRLEQMSGSYGFRATGNTLVGIGRSRDNAVIRAKDGMQTHCLASKGHLRLVRLETQTV